MFNLISKLTDEDRVLINKYIETYGLKNGFIGLNKWLKYWGKEKIKLYKLLGNSFTYTIPINYQKDTNSIKQEIDHLTINSFFQTHFREFVYDYFLSVDGDYYIIDHDQNLELDNFSYFILDFCSLYEERTRYGLKIKLPNLKRELQIQIGTKPFKAVNKFLTYIKPLFDNNKRYKALLEEFEEYRIKYSQILNDKIIKGNLVISIHPLDFMTMSDNDSNWQSCMSWRDEGCYHVGTVEMMNSNNVACCYLESERKDWTFAEDDIRKYIWNNKKWRQLVYITPEIIMTGKAYPYKNLEFSVTILKALAKLAKENLGYTYEFGIEEYNDMKYINSIMAMDRAREYRMLPKSRFHKRNILFDTKGMYNDVLNDHCTTYLCIRNKVKKTTIISVSGKTSCLCCGKETLEPDYDWINYGSHDLSYNDRYTNCGKIVCDDCIPNFRCDECDHTCFTTPLYKNDSKTGEEYHICEDCVKLKFKKCPICNENMSIHGLGGGEESLGWLNPILVPLVDGLNPEEYTEAGKMFPSFWLIKTGQATSQDLIEDRRYFYMPIFAHAKCLEKKYNIKLQDFEYYPWYSYSSNNTTKVCTKILPFNPNVEEFDQYTFTELDNIDLDRTEIEVAW